MGELVILLLKFTDLFKRGIRLEPNTLPRDIIQKPYFRCLKYCGTQACELSGTNFRCNRATLSQFYIIAIIHIPRKYHFSTNAIKST